MNTPVLGSEAQTLCVPVWTAPAPATHPSSCRPPLAETIITHGQVEPSHMHKAQLDTILYQPGTYYHIVYLGHDSSPTGSNKVNLKLQYKHTSSTV